MTVRKLIQELETLASTMGDDTLVFMTKKDYDFDPLSGTEAASLFKKGYDCSYAGCYTFDSDLLDYHRMMIEKVRTIINDDGLVKRVWTCSLRDERTLTMRLSSYKHYQRQTRRHGWKLLSEYTPFSKTREAVVLPDDVTTEIKQHLCAMILASPIVVV